MAAVVTVTAAVACGGSSPIANPVGPSLPPRSMSAVIDGVPWNANLMVGSSGGASVGILHISGHRSATQLPVVGQTQTLGFTVKATSVGTFTIADGSVVDMTFHDGTFNPQPPTPTTSSALWSANALGGSGTLTITTYSTSRVAGTFSFVAPARVGTPATGTRTVTGGVFDVTFE